MAVVTHYPFKTVWNDALMPAFATGAGAAAPTPNAFIAPTRLWTFNENTEDNVDLTLQFPHDMDLQATTLTLKPHVHWTAVASPVADTLLYWQLSYTLAKPAVNVASATTFPAVNTLTSVVNTLTGNEYRKHLITSLPDISIAAVDFTPSTIMVANLRIGGASTVANDTIGLLSIDVHYQQGPRGTDSEFS